MLARSRWSGSVFPDTTDAASELGRTILRHFNLPLDDTTSFYSEPNGKGLFLSLKSGSVEKSDAVERRAIVCDADGSSKEKLDRAEEMKLLLDSLPAAERSKVLESIGLMDRPSPQSDPSLPISSVFELDSIFADAAPVEYLIEPEIPAESVVYLGRLTRVWEEHAGMRVGARSGGKGTRRAAA